jgi:hypothetical protein
MNMKRYICFLLIISLLFSLSGCFKPTTEKPKASETVGPTTTATKPNISTKPTGTTQPTGTSQPTGNTQPTGGTNPTVPTLPVETDKTMVAVSVPTTLEQTTASDGTLLFVYAYQNLSLVLHKPAVADKIIIDFLNRVDSTRSAASSVCEAAKSAYGSVPYWVAYGYNLIYNPTRIDRKVLSLSGINEIYDGGPHPNRSGISANYDLTTGDILTLAGIMDKNAKLNDFSSLVLAELSSRTQSDSLYKNYADTVEKRFKSDATQDQDWYFTATGLCFYFDPYEIAPYSSGIIVVEIPYEKLQNLVHKDYLPIQWAPSSGSVKLSMFTDVNLKDFSHIAELIQDRNGKMYMLHTEGEVRDIQILLDGHTIFASYKLGGGDGIMIQANEDTLASMQIIYKSNDQMVTVSLK